MSLNIGFIGLGTMGMHMATRLVKAGYPVKAYNRTKSKGEAFAAVGGQVAATVAELARDADIIFSCLSMPPVVEEIYLGEDGVIAAARPGVICVDHTTVGVDTSRKVYQEAAARGINYLDAPVSGGPEGAEAGSLAIMVGGDRPAFDRAKSLLDVMGTNVQYLGESGLGTAAKLMNQYLVAVHTLAAAEVMVSARKVGLDQKQLYDLLYTSYGYSRMLERNMEHFVFQGNYEPGGALKYLLKDLRLANSIISETGLDSAAGTKTEEILAKAAAEGCAHKDIAILYQWLEKSGN